jgi:copper oxidase (laccase) domain-containing protein
MQQNTFNPTSDSPKAERFAFYQKKAAQTKQADIRDMIYKTSKTICASTVVVSPYPVSNSHNFISYADVRKHGKGS